MHAPRSTSFEFSMKHIVVFLMTSLTFVISGNVYGQGPPAGSVIDQDTGMTLSGVINASAPSLTWQQEVSVGVSGRLVGIDILPQRGSFNPPSESFLFFVNVGSPWQSDANNFEVIVEFDAQGPNDWFYVDLQSAEINLDSGDTFVWGVTGIDDGASLFGHSQLDYPGGKLYLNGSEFDGPSGDSDSPFRTHVIPITVVLGDSNLDGVVNFFDISPFINFLFFGYQTESDINEDGIVDFFDITPFIQLLSGQ